MKQVTSPTELVAQYGSRAPQAVARTLLRLGYDLGRQDQQAKQLRDGGCVALQDSEAPVSSELES